MKNFYNDWGHEFIQKIEELQKLDEVSQITPLYAEQRAKIYARVTNWLTVELERRGLFSAAIDVPATANACICGDPTAPYCDYSALAVELCEGMRLAPEIFLVPGIHFVVRIAAGRPGEADHYFDHLMRPAVWAHRMRELPRTTGRQGGHPVSRHKLEALEIVRELRNDFPGVARVAIVNEVIARLNEKYTDTPSARTIRRWIIADSKNA